MSSNPIELEQCCIRFTFDRKLGPGVKAKDLRGAIASLFPDNALFHQHSADGRLVYRYPLVQYKIIGGDGMLVGIGAGAAALAGIDLLNKTLTMGRSKYGIEEQRMYSGRVCLGASDRLLRYDFLSPWLGLNAKNYEYYQRTGDRGKRRALLERVLTGNVISLSKGLEYNISERIFTGILQIDEVQVSLKGTGMLAFTGSFAINFFIPDFLGIGKSVSRGFGAVIRVA